MTTTKTKTTKIVTRGPFPGPDHRHTYPFIVRTTWRDATGRNRRHDENFKTKSEAESWGKWTG